MFLEVLIVACLYEFLRSQNVICMVKFCQILTFASQAKIHIRFTTLYQLSKLEKCKNVCDAAVCWLPLLALPLPDNITGQLLVEAKMIREIILTKHKLTQNKEIEQREKQDNKHKNEFKH